MLVNDQEIWEQAVTAVRNSYNSLPPETMSDLNGLIEYVKRIKQNLVELVTSTGSSNICRNCGGECCKYGKFHVTVLDVIACLKSAHELVIPDFSNNPYCPYSDISGCTMAAAYRPMTCVVFNCQQVEDQLSPAQIEMMRGYEQELRDAIGRAVIVSGLRLDRALMLSCN
jgi:hypothetical protein